MPSESNAPPSALSTLHSTNLGTPPDSSTSGRTATIRSSVSGSLSSRNSICPAGTPSRCRSSPAVEARRRHAPARRRGRPLPPLPRRPRHRARVRVRAQLLGPRLRDRGRELRARRGLRRARASTTSSRSRARRTPARARSSASSASASTAAATSGAPSSCTSRCAAPSGASPSRPDATTARTPTTDSGSKRSQVERFEPLSLAQTRNEPPAPVCEPATAPLRSSSAICVSS